MLLYQILAFTIHGKSKSHTRTIISKYQLHRAMKSLN